jgi:hypothetical protein
MLFRIQGQIKDAEKRGKDKKSPKIAKTDEDKRSMMRLENAAQNQRISLDIGWF